MLCRDDAQSQSLEAFSNDPEAATAPKCGDARLRQHLISNIWISKMNIRPGTSHLASFGTLGVATCYVLPVSMMLFAMGGSWTAMFGKIAAASSYGFALATMAAIISWVTSYRRDEVSKLMWWLIGTTAMTVTTWIVVLNQTGISDILISQV